MLRIYFCLVFFLGGTATAQPLRFYIGPTLGVTTPGLSREQTESVADAADFFKTRRSPVVSPLVGFSAGFNLFKRIGLDAGIQYSYTGYRYRYDFANSNLSNGYDERMTLHKVALPVTVGYAVGLGRARLRLGAGIAYTYYFAGRFKSREETILEGRAAQYTSQAIQLVSGEGGYDAVYPRQIHPRLSLGIAPTERIIIGLAANLGYDVTLPDEQGEGRINRSRYSTHALDLTLTYSLR